MKLVSTVFSSKDVLKSVSEMVILSTSELRVLVAPI